MTRANSACARLLSILAMLPGCMQSEFEANTLLPPSWALVRLRGGYGAAELAANSSTFLNALDEAVDMEIVEEVERSRRSVGFSFTSLAMRRRMVRMW
eukprot:756825-Hanusia_phi.AAC.1